MEEEELPEGVLRMNDDALQSMGGMGRVEVNNVTGMWRAANASSRLIANDVGRRLENYTWRVLRSERVLQRLSWGLMLAHVSAINEGAYIRTTPRGSPRSSRNLETYYTAARPRNPAAPTPAPPYSTRAALTLALEHIEDRDGTPQPTSPSPFAQISKVGERAEEKRRSNLGRPPPILKKPSSIGSSGSSKCASLKSPIVGASQISAEANEPESSESSTKSPQFESQKSEEPASSPQTRRYISTRFSEEVAVSIPHRPKPTSRGEGERSLRLQGESSQKSGKKGHVVHASTSAGRKRPKVMRQRSSQGSSSGKPSPTSPYMGPQGYTEEDEGATPASSSAAGRRAVSPDSGKGKERFRLGSPSEDEDEDEDEEKTPEDAAVDQNTRGNTKENAGLATSASPLVEPDFRSKFADRSHLQHRSFTNLPSAAWRSTAVAPAAASFQAAGMMFPEQAASSTSHGRARSSFKDEIVPLKAPGPSGPDVQGEADSQTSLPRTKSQLTLLLERNKTASHDAKGKGSTKQ